MKTKKILSIVLTLAMLLGMLSGMTLTAMAVSSTTTTTIKSPSTSGTMTITLHIHAWATTWSHDATYHWYACTGEGATDACLNETDAAKAEHTYGDTGDARFTCTVCKYKDTTKQAAAALADAKTAAKGDLDTLLNSKAQADYDAADWTTLTTAIDNGKTAIDDATTTDGVATAKSTAVDAVNAVKTTAQKAAEALAAAKTAAKAELDTLLQGKKQSDYDAADWTTLTQAIEDGKKAIDDATTVNAVNTAKSTAETTANAVKTTAEKKQEADTAAANAVSAKINALPAADAVTTASKGAIDAARAAYNALTDDQKNLIDANTKAKLTNAETALKNATDAVNKAEADKKAADAVTALINSLSSASSKAAVAEARAKYDALSADQKALVSADTKAKLENAEKAADVTEAINGLTDTSTKADVAAARAKYSALTEDQKKYVSAETVEALQKAESAAEASANKPIPGTYEESNGVYTVTEDGRAIYEKPVKASSKLKVLDTVNVPTFGGGTVAVPVKEIREKAFSSAKKKLKQLTIGNNVEIIGKSACEKCEKLTKVKGGAAVKEIRDKAFASCTKLKKVPSFDNLVKIGERAFYKVKALTEFTFGKYVSKIGTKVFYACGNLKTLKFKGTCELKVGTKAFDKIASNAKATIKKEVKKEYTKALKKGKLNENQIKAK